MATMQPIRITVEQNGQYVSARIRGGKRGPGGYYIGHTNANGATGAAALALVLQCFRGTDK